MTEQGCDLSLYVTYRDRLEMIYEKFVYSLSLNPPFKASALFCQFFYWVAVTNRNIILNICVEATKHFESFVIPFGEVVTHFVLVHQNAVYLIILKRVKHGVN